MGSHTFLRRSGFRTRSGFRAIAPHQNDHPAQTPIKGHTNARFLALFRTPILGVIKHPNLGVANTLCDNFYFLFCALPTPKNGVFETTQKRFFTLLGFKSAF